MVLSSARWTRQQRMERISWGQVVSILFGSPSHVLTCVSVWFQFSCKKKLLCILRCTCFYWYHSVCYRFVTQKGTQLYCPVGNVKVDYSDQHVYSRYKIIFNIIRHHDFVLWVSCIIWQVHRRNAWARACVLQGQISRAASTFPPTIVAHPQVRLAR